MTGNKRWLVQALGVALALALPAVSANEPAAAEKAHAFVGASVIPMDSERILREHTVVVRDGKITELGPSSQVDIPDDATRIDAAGRYLLPAFADMHVHLAGEAWNAMLPPEAQLRGDEVPFERFLFPYIANGVTTIQVLSATPDQIRLRERIARGELVAPRLILARMIDGPEKAWPPPLSSWVGTEQQAREAVLESKRLGYDRIKVYSFLERAAFDAVVATAREIGMPVIGHVPVALSVNYVLDAGQVMIAHSEELLKHADQRGGAQEVERMASAMVERGTWMTPTLVTTQTLIALFEDADQVLSRPEAVYASDPMQSGIWSFITTRLYAPIPEQARASIRRGFQDFQQPLTRSFHARGGKLLAGSDTLLPGLVPGFALHRELRELVGAGLTPFEALRTATSRPHEYLGEFEVAGTIEVGKQSDLVLLDANPLDDISAASEIAGVLVRGRWLDANEIEGIMAGLAGKQASPEPAASPLNAPHPTP